MARRIVAIVFIFFCTSVAWMILGGTIVARTEGVGARLKGRVAATWGEPQTQRPPQATYKRTVLQTVPRPIDGKNISEPVGRTVEYPLPLEGTDVKVGLNLEYRQKGLLWYSTYRVAFSGDYRFLNTSDQEEIISFHFKFPAERAIYDDFRILVDGKSAGVDSGPDSVHVRVPPGKTVTFGVSYRSQGLQSWTYRLGDEVKRVRDFSLQIETDFAGIDFPDNALSPTGKRTVPGGWHLTWRYDNLLSGFDIGIVMPEKLQPGPIAAQVSFFAPVSLFFFFFLIFIITTLRGIELHPMNYFFLAAAFFAFHLLLAYLVDHISIHLAFLICSVVSIFLVISYLRLAVGMRFAAVEAAISQCIFLVLFSYAFFFKGFTGLSITVGSIITLFVVMQMTGRIHWRDKFERKTPYAGPPPMVL